MSWVCLILSFRCSCNFHMINLDYIEKKNVNNQGLNNIFGLLRDEKDEDEKVEDWAFILGHKRF